MKITKTYNKGCEWCNASGFVTNYNPHLEVTSVLTLTCPVCNGTGVILVTETHDDYSERVVLLKREVE